MTKTLTEQWREGTLPEGYYYTKVTNMLYKERIMIDYYIPELHHFEIMPSEYVKEVIVEAPSYEEFQSYEKCADMLIDVNKKWGKTIKEIKRLQEQIKEANEIIKGYKNKISFREVCLTSFPPQFKICDELYDGIKKYEEKWCVK